ncbi:DUF4865 family protein [Streptomyces purpureus]|uniref:DUF4865 domain-containing protein n=1 Tax=Streptomyces purpureus TaxID=1951 RepID=A0A918HDT9_9ACTN|nr:DUF4865 family protein [Streptomyces purpureus]GGT51176.1 DUF4865 domain-containing protein [Streptomyces purpureus]
MHAMQYEITLPADYDMDIIRNRVATRGHLLDDFPGLGIKAYLTRERGVDGSPVNQCAPFYLWTTPEGMNSFLWSPGFQGVVQDFGRPEVQHWTGLAHEEGPAAGAVPRAATRRRERLAPGEAPVDAVERALAEHARVTGLDSVAAAAVAIDPRRWELVHFTLWAGAAPDAAGEVFQVLHVSDPHRGALPRGRQW